MKMNPVIFREYDIRGVFDSDFDNSFAYSLGQALTAYIAKSTGKSAPNITVGYDARLSSPSLAESLIEGIASSGGVSIQLGLITTPISYFSTFTVPNVDGAIMVTGSHNPPEYNGFKISSGTSTLFGSKIKELEEIIINKDFIVGKGSIESFDIFPLYISRYQDEFKSLKNIPFVLDCANGAAGIVARRLYEAIGLTPLILFEEPDGLFPNHHPDPTVESNLKDLSNAVLETKSIVGIGFDGDADRVGIVNEKGQMVYGDELLALLAKSIVKKNPNATIIGDVKCSDRLFSYVEQSGGRPIMWKSGHSLVKSKMKLEGASFGGEMSGHIFFADRNFGYDDALYAGLRLLEILSESGQTITELMNDFPTAFNTPEIRIDTTEEKKYLIVEQLIKAFPASENSDYSINNIDGLRVSFSDGWGLARVSNTQPVLVLRFEASTENRLNEIRSRFESVINPLL